MKIRTTGALAVLAFATLLALVFVFARSAAVEAVYPVEKAKVAFSRKFVSRVRGLFKAAEANAENARLRREAALLTLMRADVVRADEENARLRRALGYAQSVRGEWFAAEVLSSGGGAAGARRTIRIGKGSLDGVLDGAVVVSPEGLVGRVSSVTPHTAEVSLLSDIGVKVSCEIETGRRAKVRGILVGGSEDLLEFRVFDGEDVNVPPRSRVTTTGLGGVFPAGLQVGSYLGGGKVQPSVDFSALEDVFIRRAK